jgi:hypothetical protein
LVPNAYPCIGDRNSDELSVNFRYSLAKQQNLAVSVSEFEGVGVKVQEDLLQTFLVGLNEVVHIVGVVEGLEAAVDHLDLDFF